MIAAVLTVAILFSPWFLLLFVGWLMERHATITPNEKKLKLRRPQ